jgi:hypothetical protein
MIIQFFQVRLSLQSEEESEEIAERFLAKDIQANKIRMSWNDFCKMK